LRQRQDWLIETAEHARANARRELGNVGLVIEVTRDMWGWASYKTCAFYNQELPLRRADGDLMERGVSRRFCNSAHI